MLVITRNLASAHEGRILTGEDPPRTVWVLRSQDEGATWSEHWSFVPPRAPAAPETHNKAWSSVPLDRFILARLEAEGLKIDREGLIQDADTHFHVVGVRRNIRWSEVE